VPVALHILRGSWGEAGSSDEQDACAMLTTCCFKRLAILSLLEVAVLLGFYRVDQIGIGDKETSKKIVTIQYEYMRAVI
jgi:hypothetical protein